MEVRFLAEYITHPRTVGAIMPSSKRLARKMVEEIDFNNCYCIVEYGAGTGVFTDEILKRRDKDTLVISFEYNEEFYKVLKEKYIDEENIYIVNDTAENIDMYLRKYGISKVDYIVSGLPFASLPQKVSDTILEKSKSILDDNGYFITFQYTKLKKILINRYFKNIKLTKERLNIPPAYVFCCSNK